MKNLSEIIPIYCAERDMLISKSGDITIGFALTLPEIFAISNSEYEAIHQSWIKAIKALPVGYLLHKQDWFTEEKYIGDFDKEHSFLSHASERFFHERPFLAHKSLLMLTLPDGMRKKVTSLYSSLLRKHLVPIQTIDPAFANIFEGVCMQFAHILSDSGFIQCKRLTDTELVSIVNEYLLLGNDGIRRDLDFSDGVRVGEKYCSLFTLGNPQDLPSFCGSRMTYDKYSTDTTKFPVGFVAPLCQLLSVNHIYQQFIRIEEPQSVVKELERKRLRLQSLSAYSRDNLIAKKATEEYLQEAAGQQGTPVSVHFNILAWTDDSLQMQDIKNKCSAALASIDARTKIETVGAPQLYWAGIPGNAADLPSNETFLTFAAQASCFINNETGYRSDTGGFGLRLGDRQSGRPLLVDISDEPLRRGIISNRGKIIVGPSGSGKSFLDNHLNRTYFEAGAHIVVIDVGHSYKGLCELQNGYYYTHSEESPIRSNPFYIEQGRVPDTEKKESIKTLLVTLWKRDDEVLQRSEYVALSNALQLYYERSIGFRCFNSFYEFLQTDFVKVLEHDKVREHDFDVQNFLYVLRPFYKGGEFDYLLNAEENLDMLDQPFIVFELDTIKDHPILLPVITLVIMELFIAKMRKLKGVRKMMLIEEAWKAIAKAGMAEYIKYLYKTARKYFGEPVVITQEIDDILHSDIIKNAIINNADCKILLDQSKYEHRFDEVQQLLGLTDKERTLVLSLNMNNESGRKYKEVFISLGGRVSKVYRVEVSPEEYLTYTTEEKEKLQVLQAAERFGSMEAGIKSMVL
ncbi:MAG: TraG family conjugative transposon ATPase [Sediminibacterium sp.]|uniref:TraG family conjugative transposon ATPase n=1 Tax=Sediminibacterium sp. TaxID=1917865 RepID=UPI002ABD04F4|nr:TraG family conjugative transposon ATPase [Sediminibacterium sp.]MDZ4070647.1 TraG family conjugative transposon ATPase [Sediminibacterium sp.]